ncbi:MAG: Lar family restriction alleviation protein [Ruminococcus sp.]|nr:Lar family restriction alleviation protein [Ruminococcus sp.]MBR1873640.1 Lar family restriction alleviation protein [Eubacterium sp.]
MDENKELKPCPFCGGDASKWRKYGKYGYLSLIRCEICDACSKAFRYYGDEEDINWSDGGFKKAVAAWNRRA